STSEVTELQRQIETGWKNTQYRPRYFGTAGGLAQPPLIAAIKASPNPQDWASRVGGFYLDPGPGNLVWGPWKARYASIYNSGDTAKDGLPNILAADAFDNFYVAAYAIVAAGDAPITADAIAQGITKLVPAPGQPARPKFNNENTPII